MTLADLDKQQRARLRLDAGKGLRTPAEAAAFLSDVGVALRYGATAALPIASLYVAVTSAREDADDGQRRAAVLTNALVADGVAIETNAVADRLAMIHADLAPALVALRRRGRAADELELGEWAERAIGYLANAERPTAGQVRAFLGAPKTWPNPADDALAELQRLTLIDRGAVDVPATGIAYLPKDGIPLRLFDRAHPAIVRAAASLSVADAAARWLERYLAGAVYATRRKLASMFGELVSADELAAAIERVATVERVEGKELVLARDASPAKKAVKAKRR